MINPLLAALGGAFGAAIGYRTARLAPENRATALLLVTAAASLVLGAIARAGAIAHGSPAGAFLIGLCGTAVSFAALAWCLVRAERPVRAVLAVAIIVGMSVAAAMLGYLASDLLGLASVKLPKVG
ncbi:Camphor resistance CrcB protein OS=Tsukamurella paurometabola (strain ATCC 8368 / DSM / CCUG 35730 / CIP 100753 / JCM 10117 / KCTC 9821 / NBRC 16120 / NCIMB 702349 / NCTC 13040) OX=521096 GN=Tpau_0050 PE=4 SV=1 [Tsukamurella paurometabola]|uniref:Camphor resistance CrcB protein n=1 Tax=Tsukamurella paurometabola (strain ATCC 8368 / DSM 20162 / CCUG 35730 / CIP 100753 / JCM 10117 / KCTC 9821 / NBRC 16120 / NCIMB 702349 / NCTC 13040) TaxID=521096 RepID=D5UPT6_TSUPD|nr:hypothetical protein [Tsukamurella paurometabola]ADG76704.1 camphor resistance CrcB protein [Tsukamurella paurometabola DSM 20162]SUP41291.1 Uncharacterised protein [Tsukamurella paurometabola]